MKWNIPNPLLRAMQTHPALTRKYKLEKRGHRYALLQNTIGLEALIERNAAQAWALIDSLVADVLEQAAKISESTLERFQFGLYIGGHEIKKMNEDMVGVEALWTLPLRMKASVFLARPVLKSINKALDSWFRGFHTGKLKDIEYGPLLAAGWMTGLQRQKLMTLILENDNKKKKDIRDPHKIMGAQYLLGCEPSNWNDHAYLAASHGVQRWLKRLFFQTSPHQCFWIADLNPLVGEWFVDYWQAAAGHQTHDDIRSNTQAGLDAMSFPVERWYSWWSWHSLVAVAARVKPDRNGRTWYLHVAIGTNKIYHPSRQFVGQLGGSGIDLDIVAEMRTKHPQMSIAYERWADLAACTLKPDASDVEWVQRMWDMHNASLRAPEESLPLDGLLQS